MDLFPKSYNRFKLTKFHLWINLAFFILLFISISSVRANVYKSVELTTPNIITILIKKTKTPKIGIMGALNEEIDLLRDDLKKPIIKTIAGRKYYSGTLYGRDTTMVFSGWGKVAAASTTTTLFNVFNVDMIIFTGVAGAANPTLNIGDIVLANKLYQHDMDARPIYDKYIIPLLDLIYFHSDKDLLNIAEIAAKRFLSEDLKTEISPKLLAKFFILNPKVAIGTIASGDQFVTDIKKVQALLIEQPTTKAIEMEGAAIAQVCHEYDKPFIVFRIISDKADHSAAINFQEFVKKIAAYYSRGFIKRLYPQISN